MSCGPGGGYRNLACEWRNKRMPRKPEADLCWRTTGTVTGTTEIRYCIEARYRKPPRERKHRSNEQMKNKLLRSQRTQAHRPQQLQRLKIHRLGEFLCVQAARKGPSMLGNLALTGKGLLYHHHSHLPALATAAYPIGQPGFLQYRCPAFPGWRTPEAPPAGQAQRN
jgi:hypothetical protein